jgi:hypothetical protein
MGVARGLGRIVSVIGLAGAVLLVPAPVLADCQLAPPLDKAVIETPSVFVGTVSSVRSHGFSAEVDVREVWRGAIAGHALALIDGELSDSACSGTTEANTIDLAAARPPDARGPNGGHLDVAESPAGIDPEGLVGPVLLTSIIGGVLIVTVLVARRRET